MVVSPLGAIYYFHFAPKLQKFNYSYIVKQTFANLISFISFIDMLIKVNQWQNRVGVVSEVDKISYIFVLVNICHYFVEKKETREMLDGILNLKTEESKRNKYSNHINQAF